MFRNPVSLLTLITSLAAVAAILAADPEPTAATTTINHVQTNDPDAARLNARTYELAARIAYKNSLVAELVAGRATLAQVSDEFLRLNEEEPAELLVVRERYPGSGDEEKSANNVLGYVRMLRLPADEEARLFDRLDREFADRFGHRPPPIP